MNQETMASTSLSRQILKELVEISTTPSGSTTTAERAMANRFLAAGFSKRDIAIIGPHEE